MLLQMALFHSFYSWVISSHIVLIHSSIDGHLGSFHVLVIVTTAAMNIGVHVLKVWFSLHISPGMELLDHMIVVSFLRIFHTVFQGFPGGSVDKEPACNVGDAGDMGLTPGLGGSPGGGHGNPLQYSCLENPMDRGAGRLQSIGRKESDTTEATEHTAHILFSMVVVHSCQQCGRDPSTPHPLQNLLFVFLDDGHSDWCDMITQCSFDLHFSDN